MQPSPYSPGRPAAQLAGRNAQLREITELLIGPALHDRTASQPLLFLGPDGIGRTSLLHHAAEAASRLGLLPHQIHPADTHVAPREARLAEILAEVVADAEGAGAPGIALLVDDLHLLGAEGGAGLLEAWADAVAEGCVGALIGAGDPRTAPLLVEGGAALDGVLLRELEPLRGDELQRAFTGPADRARVTWQQAALQEMSHRTGGHPARVQAWGTAMWEASGCPNPGGTITADVIETAQRIIDRA